MDGDFELGEDSVKPRVESESVVDGSSSENRLDSPSVHSIGPSDNPTVVQGVESVGRSVPEGSDGNVSDVNNRIKSEVFQSHDKEVLRDRDMNDGSVKSKQKGQRRKDLRSSESTSPVYDSMISMFDEFASNGTVSTEDRSSMEVSPVHRFEVGDMVWGKVKSHPWWPGHVYSEEFATASVRRSKRDGLLLVAFFGDSSYGWFDPSELIPFDSNFADKSRQTNSKTFVKAVEEAMDEVSRRSALGLSCMCRSKQNFRKTDVQGYFAVDVPDYEPGAVYSLDAIEKARDSFQPSLALDFVRQLALEPTGTLHAGIDFIKNKAKVISYRRAIYEEFDETYAQAFGYDGSVRPSPGSVQEPAPRKTPSKAPLSGRQVFADTSGKGKSAARPNKLKDLSKKDKYLFKRRDESKEVKTDEKEKDKVAFSPQIGHVDDDVAVPAGEYVLQKRVLTTQDELASKDSTVVMEFGDQAIKSKVDDNVDDDKRIIVSQTDDKKSNSDLVDEKKVDIPNSGPHKTVSSQREDNGPKKVKVSKRPVVDLGSEKSVLPVKKKKRKKEQMMSDGVPSVVKERVSAKTPVQYAEDPHGTDSKPTVSSSSLQTKEMTSALAIHETELQRVLNDLHSLALDPFHAVNRGRLVKTRQAFIRFRSLVFQKSLNLAPSATAEDEGNDTHNNSSKLSQNGVGGGVAPVKPQLISSGRPDDPTKGGRKRGPSDRQEEMAAKKKKKVVDIRNLTKEKKVIKKIDEVPTPTPTRDVKQPVAMKKSGSELMKKPEQRAPEPTMLLIRFPQGGSLPSMSELKARFASYGPMDHSVTRIFWKSFMCRVVYKQKAHALAAYRFVVGSSSLFGNKNVKCTLKEFGVVEPEAPPVKVPKEDHQPAAMEDRPPSVTASGVQLKSILKKSSGDEAAGNGGRARVKFMLGGEENEMKNMENQKKNGVGASSFSFSSSTSTSTTHATMDFNSKNFQKTVSSSYPLPLSTSSSAVTSSTTTQFTRAPPPPSPNFMHYGVAMQTLPPPPPIPPPRSLNYGGEIATPSHPHPPTPSLGNFVHKLERPNTGPPATTPKPDISEQMLSLLIKCNEVVTNVTNMLGYVPYHPL